MVAYLFTAFCASSIGNVVKIPLVKPISCKILSFVMDQAIAKMTGSFFVLTHNGIDKGAAIKGGGV
jgi:hypothetical protein